jgi:hypothetical protein
VRRSGVERGGEKERAERKSELFFRPPPPPLSLLLSSSSPLSLSLPRTCDLLPDLAPLGEHLDILSASFGGRHCAFSGLKKEGKRRAVSLSFFVVGRFEGEARQKVIEREFFFFFFVSFFFPVDRAKSRNRSSTRRRPPRPLPHIHTSSRKR